MSDQPAISTLSTDGSAHPTEMGETVAGTDPNAERSSPVRRLARGSVVGRYVVIDLQGRGAMGIVYAAYDPELDRKVALKLLLPGRDSGVSARLRLQREAQAIARLSHPNVVAVHDVGMVGQRVFIAMEFVDGVDLAKWLEQQERSHPQIIEHFLQAGRGLAAAHAAGLVHRDFKPENVLVGLDGRARVVDFGLVRQDDSSASLSRSYRLDDPELVEISHRHSKAAARLELTDAGTMIGTPAYMSPEQFMGESGDARSDQFSFCVSLYESLYGERPFGGASPAELSYAVTQGELRAPPAQHGVSGRLRRVLLRGLATEPADRYPGMEALLAALRKASAPRRRWWIAPVVVALGTGGAVAWRLGAEEETSRCDSVGEWVDVMWAPKRKAALAEAFDQTRVPYAQGTWERVQGNLDERLDRWVEIQRSVCEEISQLDPEAMANDPRQRCLEHRLAETSDLLSVFEQANSKTVTGAVSMVHALSSVDDCVQFESTTRYPTPSEPELDAEVRELRSELRRWEMTVIGGQTEQTEQMFDDIVGRIEALEYTPLLAELLVHQSDRAGAQGDLEQEVELSNRAFETALSCRHDHIAFQAANNLMFLKGVQLREPSAGMRWARRADALWTRIGGDTKQRVQLLNGWASVHALAGNDTEAQALYDESLALARRTEDPVVLATILNNIGAFHGIRRRTLAQTYLEEAAGLNEDLLGPDHPSVLRTRANLGIIAVLDERHEDALEILESLLPRQEVVLGTNNNDVANTLEGIAAALGRLDRFERALAVRRRVIEIRQALTGPLGRPTLAARLNMTNTLQLAGRNQAAYEQLSSIREAVDSMPEPDLQLKLDLLENLSKVSVALGKGRPDGTEQFERARAYADESVALCEGHEQCDANQRSSGLLTLAWALVRLDDEAQARRTFEQIMQLPEGDVPLYSRLDARFGLVRTRPASEREAAIAEARKILVRLEPETDERARAVRDKVRAWIEDDPRGSNAG